MAATDTAEAEGKKGSPVKAIGVLVLLTLIAAGVGVLVGTRLVGEVETMLRQKEAEAPEPVPEPIYTGATNVRRLAPIVSNLASPPDTWVRLEASLVLGDDPEAEDDILVSQIAQDVATYLRTLTVRELQGVSGLLHLREDLNERARIRSSDRVRELIVETLVVQ